MALFKAQNSFGEVDIPDELVERYEAQGWTRVGDEPAAVEVEEDASEAETPPVESAPEPEAVVAPDLENVVKRGPGRPSKSE